MAHVYVLTGLGADETVFRHIRFEKEHTVTFIPWLPPQGPESLQAYAAWLADAFVRHPRPVLVGLSFGGMVAVEMAQQLGVDKLVLLSSAKTRRELPLVYRWAGRLYLDRLLPVRWLLRPAWLTYWCFGASGQPAREALRGILQRTDPVFFRWAIGRIVRWNRVQPPAGCLHLHGDRDRILPARLIRQAIFIPGGGHLMVLDRAEALNCRIGAYLAEQEGADANGKNIAG